MPNLGSRKILARMKANLGEADGANQDGGVQSCQLLWLSKLKM